MKKVLLLSLCATSISFGATVHIKNLTNQPILARINDATRHALTEKGEKARLLSWAAAPWTLGASGITAETTLAAEKALKGVSIPEKIPHFKLIKPNKSKFFDSGLYSITKVTFLRMTEQKKVSFNVGQYKELKENEYKKLRNSFIKNYGILLETVSRSPNKIVVSVPTIETYTYELGNKKIAPLKVEARIELKQWGNAQRIK